VLLLDEPLGALDKQLREHTRFELVNIQERLGVTCVFVTHDQEEAMTIASRIGVMNHGRIVQAGTPREIYELPKTRFVAEFIGSVNMFAGRIVESAPGHVVVSSPELDSLICVANRASAACGTDVWTAVRPEQVHLTREPPESRYNRTQGTISEVAYMGGLSVCLVTLDSGKTVRVSQPNSFRHANSGLSSQDRVWVSWHESSAIVVTE
jgi:putrescine transport system ATP-binding protein